VQIKVVLDDEDKWNNTECNMCGKRFHLKPSALKRNKTHYCSKKCQNDAKKEYMKGKGNHQYGIKGKKNASWKGDIRKNSYGYVMIRNHEHPFCDNGGWVFEHRLIAEQYLLTPENSIQIGEKLYLKSGYDVHHKNFDRKDNRKENLEVMERGAHRMLHNKLNPNKRNEKGQFVSEEPELIKIKKVTETAIIPHKQSIGAAGYDLFADIDKPVEIRPHETVLIQSNIAFEIPKNYFGAVYARSGLSTKHGLRPATCVSVIDSDYRGSVGLPVHNDTDNVKIIVPKERVAQIVFQKALDVQLVQVDRLDETERGDNGFGSTGR